jgi:hypothetical protein
MSCCNAPVNITEALFFAFPRLLISFHSAMPMSQMPELDWGALNLCLSRHQGAGLHLSDGARIFSKITEDLFHLSLVL